MANINVQLKNAGGDILYPQTDWNLVQNKPSIKVRELADFMTAEWSDNKTIRATFNEEEVSSFLGYGRNQGWTNSTLGFTNAWSNYLIWGAGNAVSWIVTANWKLVSEKDYLTINSAIQGDVNPIKTTNIITSSNLSSWIIDLAASPTLIEEIFTN